MTANTSLLRPGYLVALSIRIRGGVTYRREDITPDHLEGTARIAEWQTRREILDADEHARAVKCCSEARGAIVRACRATSFGLLCPVDNEQAMRDGIEEAHSIAAAHNRTASVTRVEVFAVVGRIAESDEQAARAIGSEVRDLIERMQTAVAAADPEQIRKAASKARQVAGMLSDETAAKISAGIQQAREAAREIVRRVEKAGERAADVVAELQTGKLEAARFAVLDLLGDDEQPESISAPEVGRAVEFEPIDTPPAQAAPPQPSFEF